MKIKQKNMKTMTETVRPEDTVLQKTVRKSSLNASDEFDFKKLAYPVKGFLNCQIQEEKEELHFSYDVHAVTPWAYIMNAGFGMQYISLLDVENLLVAARQYHFSIRPDNIFFDRQGRAYVCERDIYAKEEKFDEKEFLLQYKALIGCTVGKKYKFDDYYQGGSDLMEEDEFLKQIYDADHVEKIVELLEQRYNEIVSTHKREFVEVNRKKNVRNQRILGALVVFAICAAAAVAYFGIWERPYDEAVIAADNAYMESDYEGIISSMANVDVSRMNIHQKYILAVAYVKCESLSASNQKNILNTLSWNGDEKILDYWIYLGRLMTSEAEDVAMQESSDELLYYAYLKEKSVVENNMDLSGDEKNEQLSAIDAKLQPLEDEYSKLTEEEE